MLALDYMDVDISEIASEFKKSKFTVALTGAGISSNAGIPTFRDDYGLWNNVDPEKFTLDYFIKNPDDWWCLAGRIFKSFLNASPTISHHSLALLEKYGLLKTIITQNVDGLHQKAGSKNVIELHGNASKLKCTLCGEEYGISKYIETIENCKAPRCRKCGGLLKTGAVLFGEPIPRKDYLLAIYYSSRCQLMLVIGSSLQVEPAAFLPAYTVTNGGKVIFINKDMKNIVDSRFITVNGDSDYVLKELINYLEVYE